MKIRYVLLTAAIATGNHYLNRGESNVVAVKRGAPDTEQPAPSDRRGAPKKVAEGGIGTIPPGPPKKSKKKA